MNSLTPRHDILHTMTGTCVLTYTPRTKCVIVITGVNAKRNLNGHELHSCHDLRPARKIEERETKNEIAASRSPFQIPVFKPQSECCDFIGPNPRNSETEDLSTNEIPEILWGRTPNNVVRVCVPVGTSSLMHMTD